MAMRYAVYFAPRPATALAAFGREWLGRDAETGEALPPPGYVNGEADWWKAITDSPRRYGFHATLKPPFRLAPHCSLDELVATLFSLAAELRAFPLPPLATAKIGTFLALVPGVGSADLQSLADRCVTALDGFRAAASEQELARRRAAPLSLRQQELLARWGYPYVLDEFRFHMTLTGDLADEVDRQRARVLADAALAPFRRETVAVEDLCLFRQMEPAAPFTVLERIPLGRAGS
jgi:putative phosphonate metabolism protein